MSIKNILEGQYQFGETITFCGWLKTKRDSSNFSFLSVNDGSSLNSLQVIADSSLPNYQTEILALTTACSLKVEGVLQESLGKGQKMEVVAKKVELLGGVADPATYPISPKHHTMTYLRDVAHLRPRTNVGAAIARIRHKAALAIHNYFDKNGFFWVSTPVITASDCEGAGALFQVTTLDQNNIPKTADGKVDYSKDFFGRETFLSVSGQLNVETYCMALSKVYTFGPTFRAENSNTTRHLAEFWMVEPEIAFCDLDGLISIADDFLKKVTKTLINENADDFNFFNSFVDKTCLDRLNKMIETKLVRLNYTDAIDILLKSKQKFEYPVSWGVDLQSEHERFLTEKYFNGPVALINYPKKIKSFYMRENDDKETVAAMDILVPGVGEIIGGSQREERLDKLEARMDELKMDKSLYWWYLDLRRYGTCEHAGFGLGFERYLTYITGMQNIRDVIPFYRVSKDAKF